MRAQQGRGHGLFSRRQRQARAARRTSNFSIEALEGRTLLASRLFALPLNGPSVIAELDPQSGAELRRFSTPVPADPFGENGLAFDGRVLYYMPHDNTDRLWELDPDTGSVIRSAAVGDGSGQIDGIGAVGGKVYLQDILNHQLVVVDPTTETVVGRLNVAANLAGGLTGADGPDELVATESFTTAVRIDPATGDVLGRFALPGPILGAAFVDGKLYFGSAQMGQVYVTDRTGNYLETLNIPYPVSALAGDGVVVDTEPEPGAEQIINGDFESGDLTGWYTYTQPGSNGQSIHTYSVADLPSRPYPAPPQGHFAATNDLYGPGTEVLYQNVALPAGQSARLSMLVAYHNQAIGFFTPDTLDALSFQTFANQQIRIDIVDPTADILSTAAGDVLMTVFQTKSGDPNSLAPTEINADLSAFAGRTVRLRIAIAENQNFFDLAVDSVSIQTRQIHPPSAPAAYYVADLEDYGGGTGKVIRIDAATGAQTIVSAGGQFIDPYSVAQASDGSLIVADQGLLGGTGTLFRVDPVTGVQTVITTGEYLVDPFEVVIAPDGSFLVADFGYGGLGRVVRVDPTTGAQTLVSDAGMLQRPFGIATAPDGTIFVASSWYVGETGQVFRIDPVTGVQTLIATGGALVDPTDVVVAPDGSLIVSDPSAMGGQGAIFRIDPATGVQTLISQGGLFRAPIGLAIAPDGRLIVADPGALDGLGALIGVDLVTGAQSVVASGGILHNPLGVAVGTMPTQPPVNTPPTASAGGPYTVEEGTTVTLDASGTTDPDQDPGSLTYLWDLNGNGVFGETGSAASNGDEVGLNPVFSAAGLPGGAILTISLKVIDASGQTSLATSTITIDNRPPIVTLGPDIAINVADTFTAYGSFTDPGVGEDFRASVDYGDGAGLQVLALNPDRTFDLSHVYSRAGTYSVVVYVTDGNGGTDHASLLVTVNPLTPTLYTLGGSITYGQEFATLGGLVTGSAGAAHGDVSVTLAGVTQTVAIDPATGEFRLDFSTATLGVLGSPYAITYSFLGDGTYAPVTVTTWWFNVTPRDLRIFARNVSKVYGAPDPEFSALFDGFVAGEGPGVLDGTLTFATSLPADNKPVGSYAITPMGLNSPNYTVYYLQGTLSVTQATTAFSALGSPTVIVGTASTTVTGVLGSNTVLPVGQSVTVTIFGPNGPMASGTGMISSDGRFSVTVPTASLPAGAFAVHMVYQGDLNFKGAEGTAALAVTTHVVALYDTTKAYKAGKAVTIEIAVQDATGGSLASSSLVVTAVQIVDAQGATFIPSAKGNANPGGVFNKNGSKYKYKLDTSGLAPGKYTLLVTVGNDPVKHALEFVVK
ncbi:PQQ-like domain-containing protein [Singulisphaera sp. GP187]|uniref:PKD domain-containing protein n=1 Tax=Singulisphaera sp. GP187 TaxID=1882752 RepID=UPI000926FE2D|nr:MBG domain-containing protein [Singulisphaera sp. GP187]SIO67254.1 PQQ-like domain-containing protein [Singulisphaera sp. GP187]